MLRRRGAEVALAAVLALVEGEVEPRAQSGFGGREPGVDRCLQARPGVVADGFLRRRPMGRPWWRDAALAACDQLLEARADRRAGAGDPLLDPAPALIPLYSIDHGTTVLPRSEPRARPQIATFAPGPAPGTGLTPARHLR